VLDEPQSNCSPETRPADPDEPGRPARCDYEYERNGTANLFMMFAPLEGWRHVKVTDRHNRVDSLTVLKDWPMSTFSNAGPLFWSKTSQHPQQASLYESFPAPKPGAGRRFEWHYTPKHGSWLDLAESELGVLSSSASIARIPTNKPSSRKSPPGSTTRMPTTHGKLALHKPPMLAPNSAPTQSDDRPTSEFVSEHGVVNASLPCCGWHCGRLPGGDFLDEGLFSESAIEALGRRRRVQTPPDQATAVLWSVVPFKALDQPPGFGGGKPS